MSEANRGDHSADPEKRRVAEELRHIQSLRFFRHNRALLDDALQSQALSAAEAKNKGLNFVDIYTQETALKVPYGRALVILLTTDGDWLRPSQPKPHFFIYFPVIDSNSEAAPVAKGLVNWIEKIEADGSSVTYTVTEDGVKQTITDIDEGVSMLMQGEEHDYLTPLMTRDLLDEVRSFRLAPHEHAAIKQ